MRRGRSMVLAARLVVGQRAELRVAAILLVLQRRQGRMIGLRGRVGLLALGSSEVAKGTQATLRLLRGLLLLLLGLLLAWLGIGHITLRELVVHGEGGRGRVAMWS